VERADHILAYTAEASANKDRRLVYAATQDAFTNDNPLHTPVFLDHLGSWQSLIDLHPSALYHKMPVRLNRPVNSPLTVW
jgi:hypothetical protein